MFTSLYLAHCMSGCGKVMSAGKKPQHFPRNRATLYLARNTPILSLSPSRYRHRYWCTCRGVGRNIHTHVYSNHTRIHVCVHMCAYKHTHITTKRHFLHIQNSWLDLSMIFLTVAKVFYFQFCVLCYCLYSHLKYGFKTIGHYYILNYTPTLKNFK